MMHKIGCSNTSSIEDTTVEDKALEINAMLGVFIPDGDEETSRRSTAIIEASFKLTTLSTRRDTKRRGREKLTFLPALGSVSGGGRGWGEGKQDERGASGPNKEEHRSNFEEVLWRGRTQCSK